MDVLVFPDHQVLLAPQDLRDNLDPKEPLESKESAVRLVLLEAQDVQELLDPLEPKVLKETKDAEEDLEAREIRAGSDVPVAKE